MKAPKASPHHEPTGELTLREIKSLRSDILAWYGERRRDLPWRRTRDPYAIWVSEIMLQQTTVATASPRWHRFLARFPTLESLAAAPEADVLAEWSGLGYYARARNLHAAACRIVSDFAGRIPSSFELLLSLPGMGRYTAAAVASIAFDEPVAALDANVERVLSRLEAMDVDVRSTVGKRTLWARAQAIMDESRAGDWNQAMMEMGATVCLPRAPQCPACPAGAVCRARATHQPERFPNKPRKPPMESVREVAAVLQHNESVLVLQRPPRGSFANMWEVPRGVVGDGESTRDAAVRVMVERTGIVVTPRKAFLRLNHTVMRRRIELSVWLVDTSTASPLRVSANGGAAEWITPAQWLERPLSTTQRDIALFLADGVAPSARRVLGSETEGVADLFGDG